MTDRVITGNSTATETLGVDSSHEEHEPTAEVPRGPLIGGRTFTASPWGIFAGIMAAALSVAISPSVASETFTPKYALLLLLAAAGIVPFVASLRWRRDALSSWAALAFLLIGLVSALDSAAPVMSIMGLYLWGTGWLLWLGCAGAFGVGLRLKGRADYTWLIGGLVVGGVANALLALYQTLGNPTSATFGPYQARQADGFFGNPIHLEAFLLGVIAVVLVRCTRSWNSLARWSPVLMLMAVGLEFSDERFAVVELCLMAIGMVAYRRLRGLVAWGAVAAGYGIGYLGGGSSLGSRLSEGASSPGYGLRIEIWKVAGHAFLHRPVLGYGPGLFESAIAPRMTPKIALKLGPASLFSDAHNLVVELLVTTGILGFVAFVIWVAGALSRARNPLFLFAGAALVVELVEPLHVAITPLAFLALGACGLKLPALDPLVAPGLSAEHDNGTTPVRPLAPPWRFAMTLTIVAALFLGTTILLGDHAFAKAPPNGYVLSAARRSNELLPYWPQSSYAVALYFEYEGAVTHNRAVQRHDLLIARTYLRETVDRFPTDPLAYVALGRVDYILGDAHDAEANFDKAYADDPWNVQVLHGLAIVAVHQRRFGDAIHWYRLELEIVNTAADRKATLTALQTVEHHRVPKAP